MSRPRTPNNAVCPNPDCEYHLLVEGKDIRKQGKNSAGHQRYQCMHCKAFFARDCQYTDTAGTFQKKR